MIYLKSFTLVDKNREEYLIDERRINNNSYPLGIFSSKEFKEIKFLPITCFYGNNGSGKSTLLNVIAEKLGAKRKNPFDKSKVFDNYVGACDYEMVSDTPEDIKIIASDDVFESMLSMKLINSEVAIRKETLAKEYLDLKYTMHKDTSFDNLEELKDLVDSKKKTMSHFIRDRLFNNTIVHYSNGEEALMFWEREITENAIYLLDEPENSLSAENQLKLKKFIEESVRFYNCQFIISTHSPFLLNLNEAQIYDLDEIPVKTKKWCEVKNVKTYYNFFKERENEFQNEKDDDII